MTIERAPVSPDVEEFTAELLRPGGIVSIFQPLVRISDGRVVGYEALSRARADMRRAPDRWLADAEQVGLRTEVELACLSAAALQGPPPDDALMFVNVSQTTVMDPRFDAVRAQLPPHVLELTEHEPVDDYPALQARMAPWLAQGTLLAIDDVGAGYASMAHVLRLTPAFVKIDRSLIAGIDGNRQQRSLVEALVAFAGGLHATTIGEGVETGAELDVLREIGVDIAQGWLIARPADPWAAAADTTGRSSRAVAEDVEALREIVARTTQAQEAADAVTRFLARGGALLPSVYTARNDVLRCLSRKGQWLVQDGMPPGVGITGACFADEKEIHVVDVQHDARYRAAVPGVVEEIAVPLVIDERVVGVLNVDAARPMSPFELESVRAAADVLAARLAVVGLHSRGSTVLHELGRRAPWVASGLTDVDVAERTVEATIAVTDLTSATVWLSQPDGRHRRLATIGPDVIALMSLPEAEVAALDDLASEFTSCYTGGGPLDLGFGPTQTLRERGASAMLLAPIRDGSRRVGLLCAISTTATSVNADTVEAVELLCLHTGSRLAALDRLRQLQDMVYRDALTGVSNRARWDELMDDRRGARMTVGWVVTVDVDRFKQINDVQGHLVGDQALQELARELSAYPMRSDLTFRTGGDEFALLLPATSQEEAVAFAAAVRGRASRVLRAHGADVSMGVAAVEGGRYAIRDAFVVADEALYSAKARGGGMVVFA